MAADSATELRKRLHDVRWPGTVLELTVRSASDFRAVEVELRPGRGRAALVLVPGSVDGRAVRMLARRTGSEQAELPDLHAGPELDRQCGDVRQLESDVAGEAGIYPPGGGVGEQSQPAETRLALQSPGDVVRQRYDLVGRAEDELARMQ